MANKSEYIPMVSDCILHMFDTYNSGITKEEFFSKNIIDATDVSEDDMRAVNAEVIQYCNQNGCYAALPPFEEGAFIDRSERRYTHWKVLDVQEDYFRMELNHYPIIHVDDEIGKQIANGNSANISHPCWYLACKTIVKVKIFDTDDHIKMLSYHPDFADMDLTQRTYAGALRKASELLKTENHIGGVIESYEYYMPHDLKKIVKKGKYYTSDGEFINGSWVKEVVTDSLELGASAGLNSILFCSAGPIIEMLVYINYMLSQKTTSSSTHRTITSIYLPNPNSEETRKERHFGKVKFISEKKPRVVNAQNVQRVYTTISWQRRSHLRHYASGKLVPVRSAICKRHNAEDISAPQVIYKA